MAKRILDFGKIETPFGELEVKYDIPRHWFRLGKEFGQDLNIDGQTTRVQVSIVIYSDSPQIKLNVSVPHHPALRGRIEKALRPIANRIVKEHGREAHVASWERELHGYERVRDKALKDVEFYDTMLAKIKGEIAKLTEE